MIRALTLALLVAMSGCAISSDGTGKDSAMGEPAVIVGTVSYRERIALPPGAEVHVVLLDVSRMDVQATTIAETRFAAEQGPPYAFSLHYDASLIKPRMRYSLRATIKRDGTLLFTSVTALNPFLQPPDRGIDILLQKVGGH